MTRSRFFSPIRSIVFLAGLIAVFVFCATGFAATHEVAPGGSISSAIEKARAGDTIRIAPGTYKGPVKVGKAGLTITSATTPGKESDVVVESPTAPALTDAKDTVWRGISFRTGADGPIANLVGFTGRVEYCRFEFEEARPGKRNVILSGGTFHGTSFANQEGDEEGVVITAGSPLFTYCRFENLEGGAVLLQKSSARFQNCLFVRNAHILNRDKDAGRAEMTNCVLFLNASPEPFRGESATAVALENCVYTPGRNATLGENFSPTALLEPSNRLEIQNTRTASPRFRSPRRRGAINLGIDDTRCIPLWHRVSTEAEKYGYPVTIAVHVMRLTQAHIDMLRQGNERGHEIASHGVSHAPFNLDGGVAASYAAEGTASAYLSLGNDRVLRVFIDDRAVDEIALGSIEDGSAISMSALVTRLRQAGINADLTDDSYRDVPAPFLAPIPRLDIRFKNFSTTLGLQPLAYMKYEIHGSKAMLDERLELPGGLQAMVYPYTEYTPRIARETEEAGFVCARGGNNAGTYSPYRDGLLLYRIYAESLKNLVSPPNLPAERMREEMFMILDSINDEGSVMGLYSHEEDELSYRNWQALLQAVHDDGFASVSTLSGLADKVKREGTLRDGRYFFAPQPSQADYRPRDGSPLLGAGKPLGLTHDFEGNPIPAGNPNIGLYQ